MSQVSARPYMQDFSVSASPPLAPRDPNACPRFSVQMSAVRKSGDQNPVYSHRRAYNSIFQRNACEEHQRRRNAFLRKVKKAGDDERWESRSEQILRQDFIERQRQWEKEQARTAPEAPPSLEDESEGIDTSSMQEVEMVDQIISQEDQSIEELITIMQHAEDHCEEKTHDSAQSDYGSDEEEYDQLFTEVFVRDGMVDQQPEEAAQEVPGQDRGYENDVSMG